MAGPLRATAGYHPLFTVTSLTPAFLHRIQAAVEWRMAAQQRATLDQSLSFGQYDTSQRGGLGSDGTPEPPELLPLGIVDYLTSETAVALDGAIAPRLRARAGLGYHASGGLTAAAQAGIPLQHGPRLALELTQASTRRDTLSGGLKVSVDRFSTGRLASVAEASGAWRTALDRSTGVQLGAGVAAVASALPGQALAPAAVPVVGATLNYGLPRVHLSLDARLSPQPDALTGAIYQRAGVGLSGEWRPRSDYTARASFGGSWSVAGSNAGDYTLLGEASLSWKDGPLDVSGGVRVADALLASAGQSHSVEVRAFVGVTLRGAQVR